VIRRAGGGGDRVRRLEWNLQTTREGGWDLPEDGGDTLKGLEAVDVAFAPWMGGRVERYGRGHNSPQRLHDVERSILSRFYHGSVWLLLCPKTAIN